MSDARPLNVADAGARLRSGTLSAVQLLNLVQARADELDSVLGTYLYRTDEAALAAATRADDELRHGIDRGPLHGIPVGVKDIIATADAPTTAQSLVLDRAFGFGADAPVVARLREAGAVLTGKLTTMEFAIGMPDPEQGFPTPRNPFDLDRWPGGSSSGSANGVAAGMMLAGLGSDTGGSIRLPASWTGITGLKPTFGRVPKSGCVPLAGTYDHIGPMARSARDCAAVLSVIAGPDSADTSSVDAPVADYLGALTGSVEGLRLGVDVSFFNRADCDPDVIELTTAALAVLRDAGALVTELELPLWEVVCLSTTAGVAREAMEYHHDNLRHRWQDYGRATRMTIGQGMFVTAADYLQVRRVRAAGRRAVTTLFERVDLLVTPTCLVSAPRLDELSFESMLTQILTQYWSAVGNPAISIPMGFTAGGLPVGLQLAGRPFDEATVLRAADAFQLRTTHHLHEPQLVGATVAR